MAGKRYRAKDRTVAKMERTGLVEENVRTGEKTRTSEGSTREITFDGRSDSGRRKGHAILNDNVSSSRSNSRNTGSRRFHRSRDLREREAENSGKQEPFKSYSNTPYPEKEDPRESPYLGDQKENGSRQEDYTNIRNYRSENAEPGETSNNRDHSENSDSKERTRNQRKAAEKYREQDFNAGESPSGTGAGMEHAGYPANHNGYLTSSFLPASSEINQYAPSTRPDSEGSLHNGELAGTGINSTPPDVNLSGISSEDLHRKIRKDQVRKGFQKVQAAQGQGFSSSGEDNRPGTGNYSQSTGNSAPGAENGAEALSASLQKSKLMFGDESSGMVRGAGMAMAGRAAGRLAYGAGRYTYHRLREDTEQDAKGISDSVTNEAVYQAGKAGKGAVRMASARSPNGRKSVRKEMSEKQRLITAASSQEDLVSDGPASIDKEITGNKKKSSVEINRFWQRKRYKDAYKKARKAGGVLADAGEKAYGSGGIFSRTLQRIRRVAGGGGNSHVLMTVAAIGVITMLIAASISSCASFIQGIGATFTGSTYPSTDTDIYLAEAAYSALEDGLNTEIMQMEQDNPGFDEYRYQIDEIFHNPYQLISLLTTLYGEFTFPQIEQTGILQDLFEDQYAITTSVSTESETVVVEEIIDEETGNITQIVEERQRQILNIVLRNNGFDSVARRYLTDAQIPMYLLYNATNGNRDYLFDVTATGGYQGRGQDFGYTVPTEALSDERFARMLREAERYLGYPYVWGGSSPSTSFDCSGFVCWVINHCGNGWSVPRTTADGLRSYCSYVPPEEARPGDLVFFQNTYSAPGATHVGIYVGEGMMIHCGEPIQYTSIESTYWRAHFLAFGRIH